MTNFYPSIPGPNTALVPKATELGAEAFAVPEVTQMPPEREVALRRLLDPPTTDAQGRVFHQGNFDYALESGLIGVFNYDEKTGRDGIMHILVGEVGTELRGRQTAGGFHLNHDPEYVRDVYGSFEDTPDLSTVSGRSRRSYAERPFEPYKAQVTIHGRQKFQTTVDENGKNTIARVANTMFPREYDPLAVMQAVKIARDTRDKQADTTIDDGKIVSRTSAPMIDGVTRMPIVVVMSPVDETVITAFPCRKDSGFMRITDTAIDHVLGSGSNQ